MKIASRPCGRGRARRAGSALVFVLMAILAMTVVVTLLTELSRGQDAAVSARADDRRAFYLAEAALSEAMTAVRAGATGSVARPDAPAYLGGGAVWVTAAPVGADRTRLTATALAGSGRAALETVVELVPQAPLFKTVLNSREQMTLNSSVLIDSFDSQLGSYASQAVNVHAGMAYAKANGDVSSNAGIVLNSDATVLGDAVPGPGFSVAFNTGSHVSGDTTPAAAPFSFDPVDVPVVASAGPLTLPNGGAQTIPPGTWGYEDVTLNRNSVLTVVGPATVVIDGFSGGRDARLEVDATHGPVTFVVQGDYAVQNGFENVPTAGSPMALAFMILGSSDIVFPSSSRVRGAYYAPNANITFTNANEAWGSFAGNRVDMSATMRFHYDETLAQHWETDGASRDPLDVLMWRAAAVEPAALARDRRDPFALLGVDRDDLPVPADAWDL